MPAISWFSAAGHVNGGVSGTFKAEAKDEASAQNLRDVHPAASWRWPSCRPATSRACRQMADSLMLSGEGKTVALAFSVPSEVLDVLEGMAKGRKPASCSSKSTVAEGAQCRLHAWQLAFFVLAGVISAACADHVFFYGTLMSPFNRPGRQRITPKLTLHRARHHQGRALRSRHLSRRGARRRRQPGVGRGLRDERPGVGAGGARRDRRAIGRTSPIAASTRACSPT